MKDLKIGIDNYGLTPLQLSPLDLLRWAKNNGAEGVHFSGLESREKNIVDSEYLKDLAQFAASNELYIEWGGGQHIPYDMNTFEKKDLFEINRRAAEEASILDTRIVRSCSGGMMRWNPENPATETFLQEMTECLCSLRQMLKDNNVILALETHFEFTTHELLRLFDMCETEPGDFLGICFDPMNVLTMLEDPIQAVERVLPWIVSTHIKDGAVLLKSEGFVTFPAEIGKGIVDFNNIVERLTTLPWNVNLSVEDHGGSFALPIFDEVFFSEFPDLSTREFVSLLRLANQTDERINRGQLTVTEREKWPEICEERMIRNIQNLKKILLFHKELY